MRRKTTICAIAFAAFLLGVGIDAPTAAFAQEEAPADTSIIEGEWPKKLKPVTVNVENGTAAEALQSLCTQLGFGLVITDTPGSSNNLTLKLKRHSARDVLETVLAAGNMKARLKNGILFVEAQKPAAPAESALPPATLEEPSGANVQAEATSEEALDTPGAAPSEAEAEEQEPDTDEQLEEMEENLEREMEEAFGTMGDKWKRRMAQKLEKKLKKIRKDGNGEHKERVQIGQSLRIEPGEEVDEAVAVGGSLEVAGHVRENAVAVGGSVTLEPGSTVEGDAVAVGGEVEVLPGAHLGGNRVSLEGLGDLFSDGFNPGRFGVYILVISVLGKLLRAALLFVAGILILTFMPKRYSIIRSQMTSRPGKSTLAGLAFFALAIAAGIILTFSILGLPAVPFLFLGILVFIVVGLTVFLTWIGDRIPILKGRKSQVGSLGIGCVLFFLVSLVPVLSTIAIAGAALAGVGATFLTRFGGRSGDKSKADPPQMEEPAPAM